MKNIQDIQNIYFKSKDKIICKRNKNIRINNRTLTKENIFFSRTSLKNSPT